MVKKIIDIVSNGTSSPTGIDFENNADDPTYGSPVRALQVEGRPLTKSNPLPVARTARAFGGSGNYATAAANTSAVLTYAAVANQSHILSGVAFSYSATPVGGSLTITDGLTIVLSVDILSGGAGFIPFNPPVRGSINTALTITLAAGGAGVIGKVSTLGRWTEV
jgi:hypothetical protein